MEILLCIALALALAHLVNRWERRQPPYQRTALSPDQPGAPERDPHAGPWSQYHRPTYLRHRFLDPQSNAIETWNTPAAQAPRTG